MQGCDTGVRPGGSIASRTACCAPSRWRGQPRATPPTPPSPRHGLHREACRLPSKHLAGLAGGRGLRLGILGEERSGAIKVARCLHDRHALEGTICARAACSIQQVLFTPPRKDGAESSERLCRSLASTSTSAGLAAAPRCTFDQSESLVHMWTAPAMMRNGGQIRRSGTRLDACERGRLEGSRWLGRPFPSRS
jgi:hypothetical protein